MLTLYTDAAYSSQLKLAVAANLILEDDTKCRVFEANTYVNVRGSIHAELLGICQGLEWIIDNCPNEKFSVYCDNKSIAERIDAYPDDRRIIEGSPVELWHHVYDMLDHLEPPKVQHIKSHQSEHNPNKACDMLCRKIFHYIRDVRPRCTQS